MVKDLDLIRFLGFIENVDIPCLPHWYRDISGDP